jgi:hypothetical protein
VIDFKRITSEILVGVLIGGSDCSVVLASGSTPSGFLVLYFRFPRMHWQLFNIESRWDSSSVQNVLLTLIIFLPACSTPSGFWIAYCLLPRIAPINIGAAIKLESLRDSSTVQNVRLTLIIFLPACSTPSEF